MKPGIPLRLVDDAGSLYASEAKVYPRDVDGRHQRLRTLAAWWLLGMFYLGPWLRWDGRQAVLFDLPARKFYVFGLHFWPQDFVFLALLLAIAGLALFFFTALAGRLWCGYACPQTVWTETFLWMERWAEGDRGRRIKLDAAPWNLDKLRRKGAKHVLWLLFALWTGVTFVGFFSPIAGLAARAPLGWSGWEAFWIGFYALATWGNAGVLREQVCKYMCPYARFQSAMFDRDTLIIAYDPRRGEPRGARPRGMASVLERARGLLDVAPAFDLVARAARRLRPAAAGAAGGSIDILDAPGDASAWPRVAPDALGDCIDCTLCVQVCPTGIDIRNGLQYECIACGACIDACDGVMARMGYPRGLVRYATQHAIEGRPARVLRPRIVVYGVLLLALCTGWALGVAQRSPLIAEVLRDRNALYRTQADGRIANDYTLRLVNKDGVARRYRVTVASEAGIEVADGMHDIAAADEVLTLPLSLVAPSGLRGRHAVAFTVASDDGHVRADVDSTFLAPVGATP